MNPFHLQSAFYPFFFLLGSFILTACSCALLHLGKFQSKELLRKKRIGAKLHKHPLGWENLYFSLSSAKHVSELTYAITAFFYLLSTWPAFHHFATNPETEDWYFLLFSGLAIITLSILSDFTARLVSHISARPLLKVLMPFASIYLFLFSPLILPLLHLTRKLSSNALVNEPEIDQSQLKEMIRESELQKHLDPSDQKLINSFLLFKERVAKEIMVPRVNLFSLPADMPLREAATLFAKEGYSRIPIYNDTLDEIVGVALYKDLLQHFAAGNLDAPLRTILKPILYAPENKKIAQLLQEFRSKQIHMAIIVDEYGGTEGIVTIEDILEELVGEIEDETDTSSQNFVELPDGGWVVDAKTSLIDIENRLGITIPPNPEYETLGGYVCHRAGAIPPQGWKLSHNHFDLEVLSSNERVLGQIKITPREKK